MSSFRSLYVNRTKYPHRKALPAPDAAQPSLFDQAAPRPSRPARTPKPKPETIIAHPSAFEPLPKRIYESNGLIFGLHDGGQESYHVEVLWKYLKTAPVRRIEREKQ